MHTSDEVERSPQYGALQKYLADETSIESALDTFCEEVETSFHRTGNSEDVEEPLWRAWRAVVTMAASIPHASDGRQKLADFVLELQKRPALAKDGQTCVIQDATVWQDLPIFGMEMREAWNLAATKDSTPSQQTAWINLNAWTATLVSTVQPRGLISPDFSLYGIWTIRMALEEEAPAPVALEAAAVWFLYASSSIYQLSMTGKTFDGKLAKPGSVFRDREWRGFSQSRWATWTREIEKAAQTASSDGDSGTSKVLGDAVSAMKAVDGARCARR